MNFRFYLILSLVSQSICHSQSDSQSTLEDYNLKGEVKSIEWESYVPDNTQNDCTLGKKIYSEFEYARETTFNEEGLVIGIVTHIDSSNIQYNSYKYNEQQQVAVEEVRRNLNSDSNPMSKHEWIYKNDQVVQEKEYYLGKFQNEWKHDYSSNENMHIKTKYWKDGSVRTILHEKLDLEDRIIESKLENKRGSLLYHDKFEYNQSGEIVSEKRLNSNGEIGSELKFEYSDLGKVKKKTIFGGNKITNTVVFQYDANMNVVSETTYDSNQTIIELIEFNYLYDEQLNWTQMIRSENGECKLIVKSKIQYY